MFNYFQLTLFLVLIEKFDQKSNFQSNSSALLEPSIAKIGIKRNSQEPR